MKTLLLALLCSLGTATLAAADSYSLGAQISGADLVHLDGTETITGPKIFVPPIAVGAAGTTSGPSYSLFGASESAHPAFTQDVFYTGNDTTATTGSQWRGGAGVGQFNGTADSVVGMVGLSGTAAAGSGASGALTATASVTRGTQDFSGLMGVAGRAYNKGTGTIAEGVAFSAYVRNFNTGTFTNGAGFMAIPPLVFTGTTWGSYEGLWIPSGAIDGTITTEYGVKVDALSGLTNWAFYAASDPSFFGGGANFNTQKATNLAPGTTTGDAVTYEQVNGAHETIVSVKNVTILTSGAPADVATITIPPGITRWRLSGPTTSGPTATSVMFAETAAGTLVGASFVIRDGAAGTGTILSAPATGPTAAALLTAITMPSTYQPAWSTGTTIYINQTVASLNAGTISFYLDLFPIN